ncbi:MAG: fatty acid desaturase [Myxococcales bacterium]|nr:fatty acid desaturase [Myxococcales bacterium]MCB9642930.1 fatty acid desaturase [Myxococcales bacterium]
MSVRSLRIDDPRFTPKEHYGPVDRFLLSMIKDERDLPFAQLCLQSTLFIIPFAIVLYIPGIFRWWLGAAYLVLNVFFFMDRFILMLHNTSHRRLFNRRYALLNHYIPWVLSPFFGETPETYYAHHIGMHHPENNMEDDLSSTLRFERDNAFHFLQYYLRFFFLAIVDMSRYHFQRGRIKMLRRMLLGEIGFYLCVIALSFVNFYATLVVWIIPFLVCRFVMMAGNWGQHAFVDPEAPANCYRNSITAINSRYNQRCFNDGYHIGHHLKPGRHWTELPVEFEESLDEYAKEDAVIFHGIDFVGVWALLMFHRYDKLAEIYVNIGQPERTKEELMAFLHARTRPVPVPSTPQISPQETTV